MDLALWCHRHYLRYLVVLESLVERYVVDSELFEHDEVSMNQPPHHGLCVELGSNLFEKHWNKVTKHQLEHIDIKIILISSQYRPSWFGSAVDGFLVKSHVASNTTNKAEAIPSNKIRSISMKSYVSCLNKNIFRATQHVINIHLPNVNRQMLTFQCHKMLLISAHWDKLSLK